MLTVCLEDRKLFNAEGRITFEELVPPLPPMEPGRDLWRRDPVISKICRSRKLGHLAAELFGKAPLLLAYDQFGGPFVNSIQGFVGGLALDPSGNGTFFKEEFGDEAPHLIIAYASVPAVLLHNPRDPYPNYWRALGLTPGDRLPPSQFPLVAGAGPYSR